MRRLRGTAGTTLLCLTVSALVDVALRHQRGLSGDEPYYTRIAAHPAGPHNFPYAFRVGVPYLVHALPFSQAFSWQLLAVLASGAAGGALYALLVELQTEPNLAAALAVLFTVSPPLLVVLLRNGRELDAATILVITLGSLFIVRRQRLAVGVTLLAGTVVHESCLFLIPLSYAYWAERVVDPAALRDVFVVAAVPVAAYVLLRTTIVAVGEAYQPGYTGSFLSARGEVIRDALRGGGWLRELRRLATTYGPLWLLAPPAVRRLRFARRGLVLVALCVASMTFAIDWGRAIFFAAPVFYAAGAWTMRHRRQLAAAGVAALLALDIGYGVYMEAYGIDHGLDTVAPPARGPVV